MSEREIVPGFPSTNNGIEAINQTIKRQNTLIERLEISRFLSIVEQDIVWNWRDISKDNATEVATAAKRTLSVWTAVFQWAA